MSRKINLERLARELHRYSRGELELLAQAIQDEMERQTQGEAVGDEWHLEYRKCGKADCWCSHDPHGHGPYRYRSVWQNGKALRVYGGRVNPA